jgi:uncharacterized protein involved in exopolysaccharide biosynthesis
MNRALRFVVRLFPRRWRSRYAEEFLALLEDLEAAPGGTRASDIWNVLWFALSTRCSVMKPWQWIAAGAALGFTVHAMMAFHVPDNYSSGSALRVASGAPNPEREVVRMVEASLTDDKMLAMMQRHHLYERELSEGRRSEAVANFRGQLRYQVVAGNGANSDRNEPPGGAATVEVAVIAPDPQRAQSLASDLSTMLVDRSADSPFKLQLVSAPDLPRTSRRWNRAPGLLASGVLFGSFCGLLAALVQFAWKRVRA